MAKTFQHSRTMMLRRVSLVAATAFVAVNIWTGAPLLALWIGSQMVSETALSMTGVAIVVGVLMTVVFSLTFVLSWLDRAYTELLERERTPATGSTDRSRDWEGGWRSRWHTISPVERIVVLSVYVAVVALLAWFFLLAGSPLPE